MGKGRAPCCDKEKVKRGPWSPAEDLRLINFIQKYGYHNWRALPKQAGLLRCGKSCRLRWINYLRPDVKRGNFTKEEEDTIIRLHQTLGNKWSKIASHLAGRTDNEIKNVWNTHLKKRLASKNGNIPQKDETKESSIISSSSSSCSSVTSVSSSSGKRNSELELEQQWDEGSVTQKPTGALAIGEVSEKAQDFKTELSNPSSSQFEEPKELPSSSVSSNNSSNSSNSSQIYVSNPENQSDLPFNFIQVYDDANNTSEKSDTTFDIPLESDLAFWNMLDSLGSFLSDGIQSHEVEGNHNSNYGEEYSKEAENNKWLHRLENELLGLEVTRNENQKSLSEDGAAEPLVPEMYDMLLKPEADMGLGCHHIWPSSPHISAI